MMFPVISYADTGIRENTTEEKNDFEIIPEATDQTKVNQAVEDV